MNRRGAPPVENGSGLGHRLQRGGRARGRPLSKLFRAAGISRRRRWRVRRGPARFSRRSLSRPPLDVGHESQDALAMPRGRDSQADQRLVIQVGHVGGRQEAGALEGGAVPAQNTGSRHCGSRRKTARSAWRSAAGDLRPLQMDGGQKRFHRCVGI